MPDGQSPPTQDVAAALHGITVSLVDGHDSVTILRLITDACLDLLGATAAGVMVGEPAGGIAVVAASDESARFVELLQAQVGRGPCLECVARDRIIDVPDLSTERDRWPEFVPAALRTGYTAIQAVPMRLHAMPVGGLNLLYDHAPETARWHRVLAETLADLTVLSFVQELDERRGDRLFERTLAALNDRAHIAQAVGLLAGALDLDPARARELLERHAHRSRRPLRDIAHDLTTGTLNPAELVPLPEN